MEINALIVDDEQKSRSSLRKLLTDFCTGVNVLAEAADINEAELLLKKLKPHLVFLDVEMPYGTGFDLLQRLDKIDFEVVFITAYSQYAIEAFKYASVDYILKPVDIDLLKRAVERAREQIDNKRSIANYKLLLQRVQKQTDGDRRIYLTAIGEQQLVKCSDIICCVADGSYTHVYMTNGTKFYSSRNLKQFVTELPASIFYRIHNGHTVNMNHITKIVKGHGGNVVMTDGRALEIAVRRKEDFLNTMKQKGM
jgi:two-component system LytT family response regulator